MNRAFITGWASYSCAGDTASLMHCINARETAVRCDETFVAHNRVTIGKLPGILFFDALQTCCQNALERSGLENFSKTLLMVGSSVGGIARSEKLFFKEHNYRNIDPAEHVISVISDKLKKRFGFAQNYDFSTACTSSSNALMFALRLIRMGAYDAILVVGADALCHTTVKGFHALGILSSDPCRPFDGARDGMNVAEGIGALLIRNEACAGSIEICGAAGSSDAHHITNPRPDGKGAKKAMIGAIEDAGIQADDIAYINAHGTATLANDAAEAHAIAEVFGRSACVSSTKGVTGHTLGASGALEAVICCEALRSGVIPPLCNFDTSEFEEMLDLPLEPRKTAMRYALSNAFAFGGNNVSLIFGRTDDR